MISKKKMFLARLWGLLPGRCYSPLHLNEDFRPFFIVGPPRSGNTLIRRILQKDSSIYIPEETYTLHRSPNVYILNSFLGWCSTVNIVLSELEYNGLYRGGKSSISLGELAVRLYEAKKEYHSLAFIIDSFYRYLAELNHIHSIARWGDKTPLYINYIHTLLSIFPHAQFIITLRDPADSIYSHFHTIARDNSFDDVVHRWKKDAFAVKNALNQFPGKCHLVRYENLVSEPETTVRNICDFLCLSFQQNMIQTDSQESSMKDIQSPEYQHLTNVFKPINTSSIGKGRRLLDDQQKRLISSTLGEQIQDMGYRDLI